MLPIFVEDHCNAGDREKYCAPSFRRLSGEKMGQHEPNRKGRSLFPVPYSLLLSLAFRGRLLVLHELVCLMTAHTRPAFHEWIRLQLCHLIGVTGITCA